MGINKEIEDLLKSILEIEDVSPTRIEKLKKGKYLIIIDMGCGSTSAAVLDLEGYRKSGKTSFKEYIYPITWEYSQISVNTSRRMRSYKNVYIPTLIGYSNFKPVVGPEALETGNSCENFKACPEDKNLKTVVLTIMNWDGTLISKRLEDIWPDYFACIIDRICYWFAERNAGPKNSKAMQEDTILMVAHPAGEYWSETSVLRKYRELIMQGTGLQDENILTISEAKAAMQYIRRKKHMMLDFETGVVVIDIGASTIDIEYLRKKSPVPIEYSLTMAGRDVDLLLGHYLLEKIFSEMIKAYSDPRDLPNDAFFIDNLSTRAAAFKFNMREIKEDISNLENDPITKGGYLKYPLTDKTDKTLEITGATLRSILGDEISDPLAGSIASVREFPVSYPPDAAHYIRNLKEQEGHTQAVCHSIQEIQDTWYGHLENIIRFAMDDLAGEYGFQVANVIITGGSCQLVGIQPHIWNAIKKSKMGKFICRPEQIQYINDEYDYENSVPFGGGYYVGGVISHLDQLQNFPEKLYDTLFKELHSAVTDQVIIKVNDLVREITLGTLGWWCHQPNTSSNRSTNALNQKLIAECKNTFNDTNKLKATVNNAINEIKPDKYLPKTKKEIEDFLDKMAGTRFTGKYNINTIQISIPANDIVQAVRAVKPEELTLDSWGALVETLLAAGQDFFNRVKSWFGKDIPKDDIQRREKYRQVIYDAYKNSAPISIKPQLQQKISAQVENKFKQQKIFGIPDQIIQDLRNDIMCALYLNDAVDGKEGK